MATGCSGFTLERMRFDDCRFGIKVGAGATCSTWTVADVVSRNCRMPLFIADIKDSAFSSLDFAGYNNGLPGDTDHNLYLERNVVNVDFTDCLFTDNGGYCMQLWGAEEGASHDITFTRTTLDATGDAKSGGCLAIGEGYTDITFAGLTMKARANAPAIYWLTGPRIVMTDVEILSGGWVYEKAHPDYNCASSSMAGTYNVTYTMAAGNVTLSGLDVSEMVAV